LPVVHFSAIVYEFPDLRRFGHIQNSGGFIITPNDIGDQKDSQA
jgi:hypothetical protein